ncbi:MAG: DUF6492 family protein [Nitrosomonadales bacterium]|jgi:hypothetical protein
MKKFVLYCKSYSNDVLRVKRLAESIEQNNPENIPFYVSVPESDIVLFQDALAGKNIQLIKDEDIIRANPALILEKIKALPGWVSQQIIKSEFWRVGISESYLCLDSDCVFIRPLHLTDFISPDGYPYTIVHEAKELLQFSINNKMEKVCEDFHKEHQKIMDIFERKGRHYEFGPSPLLWCRDVWIALDEQFLQPRKMNFYDAIVQFPGEMQWYGEAMLKYHPYPLLPVEPYFRVYHYERQFVTASQQGETINHLARDYLGVCYQSNWEKKYDFIQKPLMSRIARWVRRNIFRRYR